MGRYAQVDGDHGGRCVNLYNNQSSCSRIGYLQMMVRKANSRPHIDYPALSMEVSEQVPRILLQTKSIISISRKT